MSKTTLQSTPAKDVAYLKAAGWTFVNNMWLDPRKDEAYHKRNGGYGNPANAVRQQRDYERFDKGLPVYAVCAASDGYGYLLKRCVGVNEPWLTVWRYHDETLMKQWADKLNTYTTNELPTFPLHTHHYPYILAFKEKHGTFHYDASTRKLFHEACLAVVRRRNEDGNWYIYEEEEELTSPALTEEQVAALKPGYIKDAAEEEWKSYRSQLKRLEREKAERALLAKALKGDGEAAADFLHARKDAEYEEMELIELDSLDEQ